MAKYWHSYDLKILRKIWYARLKANGFIDIEQTVNEEEFLIQKSSNVFRQTPQVILETKTEYFKLLSFHTEEEQFINEIEKFIMSKRSAGFKIKEICEQLKEIGNHRHRQTIRYIIRFYEHKWKIRKWTQAQLNPPWRRRLKPPTK